MPRLVCVGHVTLDGPPGRELPGGTVSYAALAARRLGWEAAVVTRAGSGFDAARDLPGVRVDCAASPHTTRFVNQPVHGGRRQRVLARAEPIDVADVADDLRRCDALLLGPVIGELSGPVTGAFEADVVGATAQGWMRDVSASGEVRPAWFADPGRDLQGVHVAFVSESDFPAEGPGARDLLAWVPIVALTRGWQAAELLMRDSMLSVPSWPREEVDSTGAGDVFAAAFLVRYHETGDPEQAAAFAACAASCVVEGPGASSLGDRAEVERRLALRERLIEEGEWDD